VNQEDSRAEPEVTLHLRRFADGDEQAGAELMRVIEPELRRLAAWRMRGERGAHTLQTTGLVNEAYIRLFGSGAADWNSRNHFLAVASRVMRQVLVDHARARQAAHSMAP
jgi:RNA polymerase sigma factor (TIGR02999 family)